MNITVCNRKITVKQRGKGKPVDHWGDTRYKHNIAVTVGKKTKTFMFYGSVDDHCKGKDIVPDDELKLALSCFINDGISGEYSYQEFIDEFGYESCSECKKAHDACKRSLKKLKELGISGDRLYDIANAIRE